MIIQLYYILYSNIIHNKCRYRETDHIMDKDGQHIFMDRDLQMEVARLAKSIIDERYNGSIVRQFKIIFFIVSLI